MNKQSKILILCGVLSFGISGQAVAAVACSNGTATAVPSSATDFVRDGFTPKCSANVTVNYAQTTAAMAVRGASAKGQYTFGGASEGGTVKQCETTPYATGAEAVTASGTVTINANPALSTGCE